MSSCYGMFLRILFLTCYDRRLPATDVSEFASEQTGGRIPETSSGCIFFRSDYSYIQPDTSQGWVASLFVGTSMLVFYHH